MIYRGRHVNVSMRVPSGSSAIASRPVPLRSQSIMPQVVKLSHGNRSEDTSGSSRLLAELPLLSVGPRYQRTLHSDELVFWSRGLQRHALRHTTTLYQFLGILVQQHCECIIRYFSWSFQHHFLVCLHGSVPGTGLTVGSTSHQGRDQRRERSSREA